MVARGQLAWETVAEGSRSRGREVTADSSQSGRQPGALAGGSLVSADACAVLVGGAPARTGKAESGEPTGPRLGGRIELAAGVAAHGSCRGGCETAEQKQARAHPAWNGSVGDNWRRSGYGLAGGTALDDARLSG